MPIYHYHCPACGPFTAMRAMAAFRDPCACPACDAAAPRMFLSAPALAGMAPKPRSGVASNPRGASGQPGPPAAHPAGCGCCVRRWPIPGALSSKGRVFAASGPVPRSGG
ncbi:FmdB family zinc ribbon protein [Roseococcus sp. YIM B11640]|uniref:FmdB family zinc ribbon protein n=1 Tax=Roseococcus sp. YIM B11640 TaxID=3133973 RepID=UPI003C7BE343